MKGGEFGVSGFYLRLFRGSYPMKSFGELKHRSSMAVEPPSYQASSIRKFPMRNLRRGDGST
jgi:hypothetical protein